MSLGWRTARRERLCSALHEKAFFTCALLAMACPPLISSSPSLYAVSCCAVLPASRMVSCKDVLHRSTGVTAWLLSCRCVSRAFEGGAWQESRWTGLMLRLEGNKRSSPAPAEASEPHTRERGIEIGTLAARLHVPQLPCADQDACTVFVPMASLHAPSAGLQDMLAVLAR